MRSDIPPFATDDSPAPDMLARWELASRGDWRYVQAWLDMWVRTVAEAKEPPRVWSDAYYSLVEDYIEARRMAADFQEAAEAAPFGSPTASGVVRAHPGFERAAAARKEARQILADLLLTPAAFRDAKLGEPDDGPPERELALNGDQAGL